MQYCRGQYRSRRGRGRKVAWYNKKYSAVQMARKAWRGVKYIKGLVNSELFKSDTAVSEVVDYATPSVINLVAIGQGDTDATRTGNSIFIRSVALKLMCSPAVTATAYSAVSIWLIRDNQQRSDTTITFSDVFETSGSATSVDSFLNSDNVGRYSILKRWKYGWAPGAQNNPNHINAVIKMRHHVRYNGTTASDYQKGGLYLVMTSTNTTTLRPNVTGNVRVSYHDN